VPAVGERLRLDGVEITVQEADEKRVLRVEIVRRKPTDPPPPRDREGGEVGTAPPSADARSSVG
jgi:Mg2+/Co2+ transporter CorC